MKKLVKWKNKTAKKQYLKDLIDDDKQEAITYKMEQDHDVGDFINHVKFGLGFIQNVLSEKKIEVFFESSERILLQNWVRTN